MQLLLIRVRTNVQLFKLIIVLNLKCMNDQVLIIIFIDKIQLVYCHHEIKTFFLSMMIFIIFPKGLHFEKNNKISESYDHEYFA